MKKFIHLLGLAILSLSMTIFFTSCNPEEIWGEEPTPGGGNVPGGGGGTDPTQFSGSIDVNTTWPDLGLPVDYVVSGTLYVKGNALLTIEPGVTIMFDSNDGGLTVEENAGISMVGTPDKPIVFTGPTNNPNNGSWNNILINSVRNDNRLEYVQFIRGGSQDGQWRAPVEIRGKVHMNNCLVDGSLSNGITTEYSGCFYSFDNNTIKNCADYAWKTENNASLYEGVGNNNIFIANGKNMIFVDPSYYTLEDHVTLKRMSIPYYFPNGYDIREAYKYTIEPGVTMLFGSNTGFVIAEATTFIADGTIDAPITIRGLEDEPGFWNGIRYSSNKQASIMNYVNISGGGYGNGWSESNNLYIYEGSDRRLTITNCVISKSQYYGIQVGSPETMQNITHNNVIFLDCQAGNVRFYYGGEYNGVTYEAGQVIPQLP